MMHLFPNADIPIVQVSINYNLSHPELFQVGKVLAPLRDEGYAIISSGILTHSLRDVRWGETDPLPYVLRLQENIKHRLQNRDFDTLVNHADVN